MKIAIVHYWMVSMRGGEKVVEALCRAFPTADVFTHVYVKELLSEDILKHEIKTSFISRLPNSKKLYKKYLPLMPIALEQLDLRGYDLIISSEAGPAKGIIPQANATHICYCHTPMRYIWNMYHDYRENSGLLTRLAMPALCHYLRAWDVTTAARVNHFMANSNTTKKRIGAYYGRDSDVIYPPVDTADFRIGARSELEDYYLLVGELVQYKRPDLAVLAFNKMKKNLIVVGSGEMYDHLKAIAGPTVKILGSQSFAQLQKYYSSCQALIFPAEEDFGIVPVEAMASGRPVIAYNRGGATETVVHQKTGILFDDQTVDGLIDAVMSCSPAAFDPSEVRAHALKFDAAAFESNILRYVAERT